MDFIIGLLISIKQESKIYDPILVIIDQLTKRENYELVKTIINVLCLTEAILDMVMKCHSLVNFIVNNQRLVFSLMFLSSLCYSSKVKQRHLITFHLQTNIQTQRQEYPQETDHKTFINYEQINWAKILSIV